MPYRAPIDAYMRLLRDVVGYDAVAETDRFAEANHETVAAVLGEAGKLCEEVLAPLQRNAILCEEVLAPLQRNGEIPRGWKTAWCGPRKGLPTVIRRWPKVAGLPPRPPKSSAGWGCR